MLESKGIKVLIVCSGNAPNFNFEIHQAFIYDQVRSISKIENQIKFQYFFIKGKGLIGYIKNLRKLKLLIREQRFDIIHGHYSFSGLLANLQRKVPVVCTFHGSDINIARNRIIAILVEVLSKSTVYVSNKLYKRAIFHKQNNIITCGVDLDIFYKRSKKDSRKALNLEEEKVYILFSSAFNKVGKNYSLAKKSIEYIKDAELIEMNGYSRNQIALLYSACDLLLVTSKNESGPLVVKEAMACGCPIVSTDVGDVKWVMGNMVGCYLTSYDSNDIAEKIQCALANSNEIGSSRGRERILELGLDTGTVAMRIIDVYRKCIE